MKRFMIIGVLLLSFLSLSVSASPEIDQTIELKKVDDTLTFVATRPTTLWEAPALRAGESIQTNGTLLLVNKTDVKRDITFESVKLPYHDEHALEYLNHLMLIIKQDDTVLYDGPYSRINDADVKPDLNVTLDADKTCSYTVSLRCDYTYIGTDYLDGSVLEWQFSTQIDPEVDIEAQKEPINDPLLTQWLIAGIATVLICVFLSRYAKHS